MEPAATPARVPALAWVLLTLIVATFLAGQWLTDGEAWFGSGYVMRAPALALLAAFAVLAAGLVRTAPALPSRTWTLLALLPLAIVLLGLATDSHRSATLRARDAGHWLAVGVLPLALLRGLRTREATPHLWRLLVGGALVLALCGLAEARTLDRVAASFGRPAVAAAVLGALVVPAWLYSPFEDRVLRALPPLLLLSVVVLSGSRVGMVAVAVTLATTWALAPGRSTRARRLAGGGAAALLLVAGLMGTGWLPAVGNADTLTVRQGLHKAALDLTLERPLIGHGLGTYPAAALRVRDLDEARLEPRRRPEHAHLDYLHVSAEGGLPAGLALLAWVLAGLGLAWKQTRGSDEVAARASRAAGAVLLTLGIAALGDGILIDPGPALLAALAWTTLLLAPRREVRLTTTTAALMAAAALLAIPLAASFGLLTRHAIADHATQAFVRARGATRARVLTGATTPQVGQTSIEREARRLLDNRALRFDPTHPEALRQRGLVFANDGEWGHAREMLRASLETDPGRTEAYLDLAKTYEEEGRLDDARSALEDARRRDPTRVEVALRLGHLALGPEPVPGDASEDRNWIPVLKAYNVVEQLAPDRFELRVARARLARRMRKDASALTEADVLLQEASASFAHLADKAAPNQALATLLASPAEVQIEAFRIAEAMGRPDAVSAAFLAAAVSRDLSSARDIEREAYRFMELGAEREDEARALVPSRAGDLSRERFDRIREAFEPAERAFDAAALRFAALLQAGRADGPALLALARADGKSRRFRASLARYRALLAWTGGFGDPAAPGASKHRRWRAELLNEAAAIASRVDGDRSRLYYTQGYTLEAVLALAENEKGSVKRAEQHILRALKHGPRDGNALLTHARILCRLGRLDEAVSALDHAIRERPALRTVARRHFDLAPIADRPEVVDLLAR